MDGFRAGETADGVRHDMRTTQPVAPRGLARAAAWISCQFQAQSGRAFYWMPLAFAFGLVAYYAPADEPRTMLPLLVAAALPALLPLTATRAAWRAVLVTACVAAAGFAYAQLTTQRVETSMLQAASGKVWLKGRIRRVDGAHARKARLVVEVHQVEGLANAHWPRPYARISASSAAVRHVRAGDIVSLPVYLYPPLTPAYPGGWNPARANWFQGIGANGRLAGRAADVWIAGHRTGWTAVLENLRRHIARRIAAVLPAELAGVAVALVTGDRQGVGKDIRKALQVSGLAHILAISGLHMSLVAGGVFWVVRAALATSRRAALDWPVKKVAAAIGLAASAAYLAISGQGIATQRAFVMVAVMVIAILADRAAISLRNLAIAAFLVLAIAPQAVTTPSFQMSFLAVLGLIATYEHAGPARRYLHRHRDAGGPVRALAVWTVAALLAICVTTIVAGGFSGLPAAVHFNRIAPWSVVANLVAMPLVSIFVMPGAMAGMLLMPLGLEAAGLWWMGVGLEGVIATAREVARWPGAATVVPDIGGIAAGVSLFGLCVLALWRGPMRWIGLVAAALAIMLGIAHQHRPSIYVERTARTMALRNAHGDLVPVHARRGRYPVERWLLADGDGADRKVAAGRPGWTCGAGVCTGSTGSKRIVWIGEDAAPPAYCDGFDIVVAAEPLRGSCQGAEVRIDRFSVWRDGAHTVHIAADGNPVILTARGELGNRPWVPQPVPRADIQTAARSRVIAHGAPPAK